MVVEVNGNKKKRENKTFIFESVVVWESFASDNRVLFESMDWSIMESLLKIAR